MRRATWVLAAIGLVAVVIWLLLRDDGGHAGPGADDTRTTPPTPLAPLASGEESTSRPETPAMAESPAPAPQDLVTAPAATVRGRVVDADGTPRPGIRLAIMGSGARELDDQTLLSAPRVLAREGVPSDATGSFALAARGPSTEFLLCLERPDGSTQWIRELSTLPGITIDLGDIEISAPQRLTGFVRDVAGQPVAAAEVLCADGLDFFQAWAACATGPIAEGLMKHVIPDEAWIQSFVARMPGAVHTKTDARGLFAADVVLQNRSRVFVAARAPGTTVEAFIPDWASSGETKPIDLTLRPAPGRLSGYVRAPPGRAIPPGTAVTARAESPGAGGEYGRAALVAPDGSFLVEGLLAGPHVVEVQAAGCLESSAVAADAGAKGIELDLPQPYVLFVRPHDMNEAPLARFDVLLCDEPHALFPAGSDSWRRIHAELPAGETLRVKDLRSANITLQVVADGMAGLPVRLAFGRSDPAHSWDETLRPLRTLRGVVVDELDGQPVAGARVQAKMPRGPDFPDAIALSGPDGRFELPALPVVALALQVESQGFAPDTVDVRSNATAPIAIELQRLTLVQVRLGPRLRDAVRAGLLDVSDDESDVAITPVSGGKPDRYALRAGGLLLDDLAPGSYRIELLEGAGNTQPVEFSAVPGEFVVVDV
jgi:hypothetical protein